MRSVQNFAIFACAVIISWDKENPKWQLIFKENKCKRFSKSLQQQYRLIFLFLSVFFFVFFFQDLIYLGTILESLDDKSSTSTLEDSPVSNLAPP